MDRRILTGDAEKAARGHNGLTWVYVICWRSRGPCKIGVSDWPKKRLTALQSAHPYKLFLVKALGVQSATTAYNIEQAALFRLRGVKLQYEWVDATAKQTLDAVISSFSAAKAVPQEYAPKAIAAKEPGAVFNKITREWDAVEEHNFITRVG